MPPGKEPETICFREDELLSTELCLSLFAIW